MEIEKFKTISREGGVDIIPVTRQTNILFRDLSYTKGIFKYLSFDCQISNNTKHKSGHCKTFNGAWCCCHSCKNSVGFLRIISEHILKKYARHFNEKTGYWRQGKGCILNHTMRSSTCLTYNCNDKDPQFQRGISQIRNIIYDTEQKILKVWKNNNH